MITHPVFILLVLLIVEIILLSLPRFAFFRKFFNAVPVIFFLFASGMILSNVGIIQHGHMIYQQSINILLPAALFLMLVTVDVRSILHLGSQALIVFLAGMLGVMVGMVAGFWAIKAIVGTRFATGFGALAGSWTGGSANMIAVKEALSVPEEVFSLMLLLDSTIPYIWMGFLIFLCTQQERLDLRHGAKHVPNNHIEGIPKQIQWSIVLPMVGLALALSFILNGIDDFLPLIKGVISPFTWTIVLVTVIALCFGMGPLGRWAQKGVGPSGQWVLFFVLLCIGTKGDLSQFDKAPWLFLAGFIALVVHGLVVYTVGRIIKAPVFLMAVASQANLGGVASASMLAEIYRPGLASVGLLMAILGNILGTYVGILTGQICHFFN